jgi:3-oxoacyl-[acyl-carrier-protein] reductase
MNIDLKNKVIVITGASKGIGSQIAYCAAKEGAKIVINYNTSLNQAKNLLEKISMFNENCMICKADVTNKEEVSKLCKTVISTYGKIDILINNAGICNDNLCVLMSEKQWQEVMNTNVNGVFLCSKIISKEMIYQNYGKIINIASYKGQIGSRGQVNYTTSKAAVIGFTKALAKELGDYNISVNALCPAYIQTDMNRECKEKKEIAKERSVLRNNGGLNDLVNFIILLCSDKIVGISGRVFNLDSRIN